MFNQIERDVLGQNCLSGFNQWCLIVRKTPSKFLGEFMGEIFCSKDCYVEGNKYESQADLGNFAFFFLFIFMNEQNLKYYVDHQDYRI